MTRPANHASPNAVRKGPTMRRRAMRGLGIGLVAALLLSYLGALGTDTAPFAERLAYWAMVILPGSVLGLIFTSLIRDWGVLARYRWVEAGVVALAISLPHTFLVVVASALFFGVGTITPERIVAFWSAVLILTLALTAINYLAAEAEEAAPVAPLAVPMSVPVLDPKPAACLEPDPQPAPAASKQEPDRTLSSSLPALPDLIGEKLGPRFALARLIAMEAEDHYLRVYTDGGSALVLMRLADACALLPESAGARVHRSWWAARGAVQELGRREGKAELTLQTGLKVPVSRAMQAVLRAQGWG